MAGTLVVGLGNRLRGDDAIGFAVAAELTDGLTGVEVLAHEREPIDLIELWGDAASVVVIDAIAGESPGRIHRLDGLDEDLGWERRAPSSSHAFHLGQVIELARSLRRLPPRLELIAIEGTDFATGTEPSAAVQAAGRRVARELIAELG